MGMHFGVLGLDCPRDPALAELVRHAGEFREVETLGRSFPGLDWVLVDVDEHRGRTLVTDSSCRLAGLEPDAIVSLSSGFAEPVVASYAETTSGSFGLVVARAGQLLRLHQSCHAVWSRPLSVGEPLPFEASVDLEGLDGAASIAALRYFGFVDPDRTDCSEAKRFWCRPTVARGRLRQLIAEHEANHAIPSDRQPKPQAVGRILDNPADRPQA